MLYEQLSLIGILERACFFCEPYHVLGIANRLFSALELHEIAVKIISNLAASVVGVLIGWFGRRFLLQWEQKKFESFFASSDSGQDLMIVYGTVSQNQQTFELDIPPYNQNLYKEYSDGEIAALRGSKEIINIDVMRSSTHLIQEITKIIKNPISVLIDRDALKDLDHSILIIGGPVTNEMTKWALEEEKVKQVLEFKQNPDPRKGEWMLIVEDQKMFEHKPGNGGDYGALIKVKSTRFPNHFFFICAGIGSWGTSASAWYLAYKWKQLKRKYGKKEFMIILEVKRGSDSSAKVEYERVL